MFQIDTHVVPGGCQNNQPAQPLQTPASPPTQPTDDDVAMRDTLIADQENLLNTYRCMFQIDTHVVPGGCQNNQPARNPV
ncbi:MAG: hypothetical protein F4X68_08690 [Acidimicrobiia bacterium]|nr:hypothetical protein [Acidimicrobiia bacterium]MXZ85192.1 hypothetical protein [Acidimicrobiia bacterium]MYB11220.1 hypothetical protein [Acidimicrobiia bacterium]MYB74024.1 hypothetical protein [Acidimicrobiia bacterium]MYE71992.1 hypothetical protein [Acidimicrobiia bacterium]